MKSVVELIYYRSFLGVRKNVNDEFYAGRSQLRIQEPGKKNTDIPCTKMDVAAGSVNEESGEQVYVDSQSTSVLPTFSFCDAETRTEITGRLLDRLEVELKATGVEKDKIEKAKEELTRDSKKLQNALKNP